LLTHIPQCYRSYCLNRHILPLCTCNTCKGRKTHHGDEYINDEVIHSQYQNNNNNSNSNSNNNNLNSNRNNNHNNNINKSNHSTTSSSRKLPTPNLSSVNSNYISSHNSVNSTPSKLPSTPTTTTTTLSSNTTTESQQSFLFDSSPTTPTNNFSSRVLRNSTPQIITDLTKNSTSTINTPTLIQTSSTSTSTSSISPYSKKFNCLCCGKNLSRSLLKGRLPLIYIRGSPKKKVCFCKKGHIFNKEESEVGLLKLDTFYCEAVTTECENGEEKELNQKCAGFLEQGTKVCNNECGELLWCEDLADEKIYFCTPDHLMVYLQIHYPFKLMGKRKKPTDSPLLFESDDENSDSVYSFVDSPAREVEEKGSDEDYDNNDNNDSNNKNKSNTRRKKSSNSRSNNNGGRNKHTGYSLFCEDNRLLVQEENPNHSLPDINKQLSVMWAGISRQEKRKYAKLAMP